MAQGGMVEGAPGGPKRAGSGGGGMDPTLEPGNYGPSLFGVQLPQGTGASGTAGAYGSAADPTNEPGQTSEGFTGLGPSAIAETGAPGSGGAGAGGRGSQVSYTLPGSFLSGTHQQGSGGDATEAVNEYGSGPQLPGIEGNMPSSTGAGGGRVLHGGRPAG